MGKTTQGTNYPWGKWLRPGSKTTLRRDRDYFGRDGNMVSYIYRMAKRFREEKQKPIHVSLSQPKDGVIVVTCHKGDVDGRRKSA